MVWQPHTYIDDLDMVSLIRFHDYLLGTLVASLLGFEKWSKTNGFTVADESDSTGSDADGSDDSDATAGDMVQDQQAHFEAKLRNLVSTGLAAGVTDSEALQRIVTEELVKFADGQKAKETKNPSTKKPATPAQIEKLIAGSK